MNNRLRISSVNKMIKILSFRMRTKTVNLSRRSSIEKAVKMP